MYTIERVRSVNGKIVREKSYLPQGYSGMTKKQQDKSLKKQTKKKSKKSKKKKEKRILKKPKIKLPSYDPKRILMKGAGNTKLVREGKSGYFNDEYNKEIKWLSNE